MNLPRCQWCDVILIGTEQRDKGACSSLCEGFIRYSRPIEIGARTARAKGYDRPETWPIPKEP